MSRRHRSRPSTTRPRRNRRCRPADDGDHRGADAGAGPRLQRRVPRHSGFRRWQPRRSRQPRSTRRARTLPRAPVQSRSAIQGRSARFSVGLRGLGHLGQQLVRRLLGGHGNSRGSGPFARRTGSGLLRLSRSGLICLHGLRALSGRLLGRRLARCALGRRLLGGRSLGRRGLRGRSLDRRGVGHRRGRTGGTAGRPTPAWRGRGFGGRRGLVWGGLVCVGLVVEHFDSFVALTRTISLALRRRSRAAEAYGTDEMKSALPRSS